MARHLILKVLLLSATEEGSVTRVSDPATAPLVMAALRESGFIATDAGWVKASLAVATTAEALSRRLRDLAREMGQEAVHYRQLADVLASPGATHDTPAMVEMERALWPAKILDAAIPTFIMSIKPRWAQDLFDEGLARQTLLGADPTRVLNSESVYYRSARPAVLTAPARILWYVKRHQRYQQAMTVRACSFLDEVIVDTPKVLFRQFERLGVYTWKDIVDTVNGNVEQPLMAVRFSNTELLPTPVSWGTVQRILSEEGCPSSLQSPSAITPRAFQRIYGCGTGQNQDPADVA